jgi:hypothetical protein
MNRRTFAVATAMMQLVLPACGASTKTVEWEEEVPLNSGEIIWVKRADTYISRSEPGNPLQMGWWLDKRAIAFDWKNQQYTFQTNTTDILMLQLSDTTQNIEIVAWTKECSSFGFGEFRWLDGTWQLQPNVSPVLINQPRNLMWYASAEANAIPTRVTKEIKQSKDIRPGQREGDKTLALSRIAINCSRSK